MVLLDEDQIKETIDGLIRIGTVAEHSSGARVRCTFEDRDGLPSNPMPVLQQRATGDLDYAIPAIGAPVVCLMLPPDQTDGFVLGGYYDARQAPPTSDQAVRVIAGSDVRLGSVSATHKVPLGDVLLRVLAGLREVLATAQVATPAGPGQITAATTDYGSGLVAAIAAQMALDVADAVLLSQKILVQE
jgi:phage baseplate assembly protein gpV